jgi:ribonuclease HI
LVLHSDSQLMVRQLAGQYKVKAAHLAPLHQRALALRRRIPGFQLLHVPREQNNRADGLANRAIDERTPPPAWLAPHLPATGR